MKKKQINISVPVIIDTYEFHPTNIMQKVLLAHLKDIGDPDCDHVTNPPKFLTAMGHDRSNWYKWQRMPGFREWWDRAIEEELRGGTLRRVHANLARLAQTQRDSSTIKLFLERFDNDYKPASKREHEFEHMRPWPVPPEEAMAARECSMARFDKMNLPQQPLEPPGGP